MFWVDEIVNDIIDKYPGQKEFIIRDEKTLSGRVHIGSLRGVVIHGIIAQVLNERGKNAKFIFEFNDYDPMDGMPKELEGKGFDKYMGMPLCNILPPDDKAKNFAEYYGEEFLGVINEIGFQPEVPRASNAYKQGRMNDWIRLALTENKQIREIYRRISGSEKEEHWSPVQVICEKCGKVGSTDVLSFDGEKVKYVCKKDKVTWAEGCGYEGEVSPFDGHAELTWKMEWPAKWDCYNVTIEGSGKDHNAAGGSHDIGEAICAEVSKTDVPYNIPYEFFLVGGKKMSSSKGVGQTAREIADLVPPEILRFLMVKTQPKSRIEFDPEGDTIPRLFDQHDEAAKWYFHQGEKDTVQTDLSRAFKLSQTATGKPKERFLPRFSQLVFIMQIPRLDVYGEVEKMKGAPLTKEDREEIRLRMKYAQKWLETYAPDHYQYQLQETLPEIAGALTENQKEFTRLLAEKLENIGEWEGELIHGTIHELIKEHEEFTPKDCFQAIYRLFLGKDFGPQAGWFLSALEQKFVIQRLKERHSGKKKKEEHGHAKIIKARLEDKNFRLSEKAIREYPEVQIAYAIIEGVTIKKESGELEKIKEVMLPTTDQAEKLLENAEILKGYKAIYRKMKIDPTKKKPTSIAMLDRIIGGQRLYKINTLVDLLNLLTLQNGISFGAFDMEHFQFPITFDLSSEEDEFHPLMEDKAKKLKMNELCMFDAKRMALNRDYNYRDSDITKITPDTKNIFIAFDALDPISTEETKKQLTNAANLITKICGGKLKELVVV